MLSWEQSYSDFPNTALSHEVFCLFVCLFFNVRRESLGLNWKQSLALNSVNTKPGS